MRFPARWDRTLRLVTTATSAAAGVGALLLLRLAATTDAPLAATVGILLATLLLGTILVAFLLSPRGYTVDAGRLRIVTVLRDIEVPFGAIRAAVALPDGAFAGSIRVAGSAGLFGYYGRFWSRSLGAYRLYATRRTGLVLVDTATDRFLLSPEPPDRFVEVLVARAPAAGRAISATPLSARPLSRATKVGLGAVVVLLPVVVAVVVGLVWAYEPVGARIDGGEIRIERKLAPAVVIPLAEVHRALALATPDGCALRRVVGTAVPGGVRYGQFRSAELGDVQLYAWRWDRYVLVETDDGRVVLTPEDPAAFLAAVAAARP